jgi:two-component system sensor histidine kinase RegB
MPLPGMEEYVLSFPNYYVTGILISLIIGLIFLSYFGIRFSGETKKRSNALNKLQQILAKEYELESLGGQAAAAAHSLGTPLATISVVSKEMRKEVGDNSKLTKDIDLLISQTKRCSEILKKISQKKIISDEFLSSMNFESLLDEIIKSFKESSEKNIQLNTEKDINKIDIKRNPELVYGLRNFIGNAVKFSNQNILISIISDNINLYILIEDDGPGFPEDIIKALGEPYIKSRSKLSKNNVGLGLGTFLGKTLLERQSAIISFENYSSLNGAKVKIKWRINDLSILT